jgi:chromosome segregation ATPase
MNQPTPTELITKTLETLSHNLHSQIDQHLKQTTQEQQAQVTQALSTLIPSLLEQLIPIIEQEVQKQNQPMLNQVEACLNELKTTNQQQLTMLKLGREEYQLLQTKIQSALSQLESIPSDDDNELEQSLTDLKTSIQTLQTSTAESNSEQQDLENTVAELTTLKTSLQTRVTELTKLQQDLDKSLSQFQPLLKP